VISHRRVRGKKNPPPTEPYRYLQRNSKKKVFEILPTTTQASGKHKSFPQSPEILLVKKKREKARSVHNLK
jgi:hypothetical protein